MSTATEGFRNAIVGVISGIIIFVLLEVAKSLVPPDYLAIISLIEIMSLIGSILLIEKMESWGIYYLIGWLIGMGIMYLIGLVEEWLATIYLVVGFVILIQKFLRKLAS